MDDHDAVTPASRGGVRWARRATARDVAAIAGVSPQTVSRVVNRAASVRPETRQRVLEAMTKVGYAPNAAARTLRSGRSYMIGVVTHHLTRTGEAKVVEGVIGTAHAAGYAVSLVVAQSGSVDDLNEAMSRLHQGAAGLIVIGLEKLAIADLRFPNRLPLVINDARPLSLPSAGFDQFGGAHTATTHLLGLGHRSVHHLAGPADSMQAHLRRAGWQAALAAAGRPAPATWTGDWTPASGYRAGLEIAADPAVTAVFVANDEMATGLYRALHEAGRRIPQDVSVVGFDDLLAEYLWPPLTSVHQDFDALGQALMNLLVEQIEAPDIHDARQPSESVIVPSPLVVRASSGPPPSR